MQNKNLLVIGGTRGLGRAFVKMVAEDNNVNVAGKHEPTDRIEVVEYSICDIVNESGFSVDTNIDCLLFFQRYRGEPSWANELAVGLTATKNIINDIAPHMNPNGSIVIISSIISKFITTEQPLSYHVCKAGLEQMARWYAVKLGPKIRVNTISPCTVIKDESLPFYMNNTELMEAYEKITPMGLIGTANDVARVARFLCSDDSKFVTGQNIVVDGGRTLQNPECLVRGDVKVTR